MSATPVPDPHELPWRIIGHNLTSHDELGVTIRISPYGALFRIYVNPSQFQNSPNLAKEFRENMEKLRKHEDKERVFSGLVFPHLPKFLEKAKSSHRYEGYRDVPIYRLSNFFPKSMHTCKLSALNDTWILEKVEKVAKIEDGAAVLWPTSVNLLWEGVGTLPVNLFRSARIGSSPCDAFPHAVSFNEVLHDAFPPSDWEHDYGFRAVATTSTEGLTDEELKACKKTSRPGFPRSIRIVRPRAFVVEPGRTTQKPRAFLGIAYGPVCRPGRPGPPGRLYRTLHFMVLVTNPSWEDKMKWKTQLEETVHGLVEEGIVWKNASPENILVDAEGDIVIDWLRLPRDPGRWVSKENRDTMSVNAESLANMIRFIDPSLPGYTIHPQWALKEKHTI